MINALQVLYPKLPCDPFRDCLPVALLVNASHPWKTMRDVVEAVNDPTANARIRQLGAIPVA